MRSARAVLILLGLATGCAPRLAPFSELAYEQAISLKVDALALTSHAAEPFARHREAALALTLRLEKAYEFARGRPRNEISAQQWEILRDPERNLLGGFLRRWESASTLSPAFIEEARRLIADAFDTIIGLESGKIKPDAVP